MKWGKRILLGVVAVYALLFVIYSVYIGFIQARPGDWTTEDIIKVGNNADFEVVKITKGPEKKKLFGLDWIRHTATATFAGHPGIMYIDQNKEAGVALKIFIGGSVRVSVVWEPAGHAGLDFLRGCVSSDFEDLMEAYLEFTLENPPKTEKEARSKAKSLLQEFESFEQASLASPCTTMYTDMKSKLDKICKTLKCK